MLVPSKKKTLLITYRDQNQFDCWKMKIKNSSALTSLTNSLKWKQ